MADKTATAFENFDDRQLSVSAAAYEIVLSFFSGLTTNAKTAKSYSENLFKISQATGIDVMTLLGTFEADDKLKVTLTMAYYLNSFSDKTVMYGASDIVAPNYIVARNIIQ